MKRKLLSFTIMALAACAALSAKTKLTVKNTVGGDRDQVGDYDLFSHTKESDINGETQSNSGYSFGDRFQIDLESDYLTGRFRLESIFQNVDSSLSKVIFAPSGFVHFTPLPQLGIIAGNNFYKYFAIPSAYLAAADDTTKYGRLLTDSLGEEGYFGNDSLSVFTNGFAGGITSDWTFSNGIYAKFAGGGTFYPATNEFEKAIDFGANSGLENLFDLGFTAHNITEDDKKFGAFLGYTGNTNLIANLGFYYNFTTSDYLPEERVTGSDDDDNDVYKYKKQSTKYALGLSGGYKFEEAGLGIYGDLITGLTNEYIGTIKYYDTNGNLIDSQTATIARGDTIVKYYYNKKGTKAKSRNDKFTHAGIPLYAQIRLTYTFSKSFEGSFSFKIRTLMNANDTTWITLYPRVKVDVGNNGSIGAGLRFDMNAARYDGLSGISIPLTYTYKFKKKF